MVTGNPRIFFFKELLDEVYLLLDHVSRQNNQSLTTLTAKGDNRPALVLPGQEGEPTLQAILAHVAKLRLPPAGDENRQAEDAAFLLMLRDRLSSMVAPANGLSIAFTTMTVGFMRLPHRWRRCRSPLVPGYSLRRDMAMSAYPTLARPAQATSSFITLLILALLLLGGLIVGLSGAATYGRSLLQQLAEANRAQATAQQMIETAQPAAAPGLPSPASAPVIPPFALAQTVSPAPPKAEDPPLRYCDRARRLQSTTPPPLPGREALPVWESVQQAHLCGRLWDAEVKIGLAQERMASFLALFARPVKLLLQLLLLPFTLLALLVDELLAWIVPGPGSALNQAKAAGGAYALAHNPRPDWSCEDFVMALTRHALPLCFTLLGTGISILRDCSQRMHRFELVPTTLPLGLSRLALGLAAGLSIALFNSPDPPAAILPGLPPPPPADMFLSAQALAFLAGYGVDSVFSFFDNQLSRLREPLPRPPAPRPS